MLMIRRCAYVSDIYGYLRSREVSLPRHRLLKSCLFYPQLVFFFVFLSLLVSGEAEAISELLGGSSDRNHSHDEVVPGGLDGPGGGTPPSALRYPLPCCLLR